MSFDKETAPARRVVALFDFDGTITHFDSFLPFLRSAVGFRRFWGGLLALTPALVGSMSGRVPNWRLKEYFLTRFLKGLTRADLVQLSDQFCRKRLPGLLNPGAMERVRWHRDQGHRLVLLSASPEVYLRPWAIPEGFHEVLATGLDLKDGMVTGLLQGRNCHGEEKVERARALLGSLEAYESHGYGDSRSDRPLLNLMSHAYFKPFGADSWSVPRFVALLRWGLRLVV